MNRLLREMKTEAEEDFLWSPHVYETRVTDGRRYITSLYNMIDS